MQKLIALWLCIAAQVAAAAWSGDKAFIPTSSLQHLALRRCRSRNQEILQQAAVRAATQTLQCGRRVLRPALSRANMAVSCLCAARCSRALVEEVLVSVGQYPQCVKVR